MGRFLPALRNALALPLAAAAISCGASRLDAVPRELIGTWVAEGRYAGRHLKIEQETFSLGARGVDLWVYEIEAIDAREGHRKTVYRLHHRADEGYEDALVLTYESDLTPTLHVGASPEPWTRTPSRF